MIFALNRTSLTAIAVFVVVAIVCALTLFNGGTTSADIWARRGAVLLIVNLLVMALCMPRVFGIVHALTFARYWWFPRLDGEWDAVLHSNWPRVRRTYASARDGQARFDALVDEVPLDEATDGVVYAKVIISSSLIYLSVRLEPVGSKRTSRSRFVRPMWRRPDLPELTYVYEQEDLEPVARTDEHQHFGAGVVKYDPVADTLFGEYWTQRRADSGLNTAGTITMTRSV